MSEVIGGFLVPGRPLALMVFKTFGFVIMSQALAFTGDLSKQILISSTTLLTCQIELGHYMKIPPKMMFSAQVIATIVSAFVVLGVQAWQVQNIADFCSPTNKREVAN